MAASTPSRLSDTLAVLKASRPVGWTFGGIFYAMGVVHSRQRPQTIREGLQAAIHLGLLSLPLCIVVFAVNDVYDYETDVRNPRKDGGLQGGLLAPRLHNDVLLASKISTALIFAGSLLPPPGRSTPTWQAPLLAAALLLLSWQYSSPPLRLKEVPVLDGVTCGAIVWLCWAWGYVSTGKALHDADPAGARWKGLALGLWTVGLHAVAAAADVEPDREVGQRTVATVLGGRGAAGWAVLAYLAAAMLPEPSGVVRRYSQIEAALLLVAFFRPNRAGLVMQLAVYSSFIGVLGWFGAKVKGVL